ncbi:uncharacterized protein F4822DRAFT_429017 [Hypoxylon trugodes]|uniref:uncharacterized protein n=1 Tax=Hypoxylon trugodes TaxID=326681 RepID=UPI0021A03B19|nr:uncharacterized protein F4822DRAFT_429017 [Hypoxylon trugodes]KAI1388392.1 hypothetical protein F4822DRAFT_429017 [Hypoxylon trugodes]
MYTKTAIIATLSVCASAQHLLPRQTSSASDFSDDDENSSPECISRIQEWSAAMPTPGPDVESALNKLSGDGLPESGLAGLCIVAASLTGKDAQAFSSYQIDMYSYISAQSSNLNALATSCSSDMGAPPSVITSELTEYLSVYSGFSAGACKDIATTVDSSSSASATASAGASVTSGFVTGVFTVVSADNSAATASASNTGSAASSTTSSPATVSANVGPRETGMLAAAVAAVGVIGAAVML